MNYLSARCGLFLFVVFVSCSALAVQMTTGMEPMGEDNAPIENVRETCRLDSPCREVGLPVILRLGDASSCVKPGYFRIRFNTSYPQIIYNYDYHNNCAVPVYVWVKLDGQWRKLSAGQFPSGEHYLFAVIYNSASASVPEAFAFSKDANATPDSFIPRVFAPVETNIPGQCEPGQVNPNVNGYSSINAINGSVIESIPLVGLPFTLNYSSERFKKDSDFNVATSLGGWTFSIHHQNGAKNGLLYYGYGGIGAGVPTRDGGANPTDQNGHYAFWDNKLVLFLSTMSAKHLWMFEYDEQGRLTTVLDRNNQSTTIRYQGDNATIKAPGGQETILTFDGRGFLSKVKNPKGEEYQMSYHPQGFLKTFQRPEGHRTTFYYSSEGDLTRDESISGSTISLSRKFDHTLQTQVSEVVTAEGRKTQYTSQANSLGQKIKMTTPYEGEAESTILKENVHLFKNIYGERTTKKLASDPYWGWGVPYSQKTDHLVDGLVNLSIETEKTVEVDSTDDGLIYIDRTKFQGRDDRVFYRMRYAKKKMIYYMTAAKRKSSLSYSAEEKINSFQIYGLEPIVFSYDEKGNIKEASTGERVEKFEYDSKGNLSRYIDAQGDVSLLSYDDVDRLAGIQRGDKNWLFKYDREGRLTSLSVKPNSLHNFSYDILGLVKGYLPPRIRSQISGVLEYSYNKDKQVIKINKPDGTQIDFTYGSGTGLLNRIDAGEVSLKMSYVPRSDLVKELENSSSRIMFDYTGSYPVAVTNTGEIQSKISFGYNQDSTLASIGVAGGDGRLAKAVITYDKDFLMVGVGDIRFVRNEFGAISSSSIGSLAHSDSLNRYGEIVGSKFLHKKSNIFSQEYLRDKLGRIVEIKELFIGKALVTTFKYATTGELIAVKSSDGQSRSYEYDSNGNRLKTISSAGVVDSTYDDQDRLIKSGNTEFVFNDNGELVEKKVGVAKTSFKYDSFGNLKEVRLGSGKVIQYVVDGLNRRVGKKIDGKLVQSFVYQSQTQIAAELDASGKLIKQFFYGSKINVPDYMVYNGKKYRIISDHLGSPRVVIDVDSGKTLETFSYDEFGRSNLKSSVLPFGFAGGLGDADTGFVRFGARDYDPEVGRWTSKDPIGFAGGDVNLYGYVFQDPVNFIDPSGKFFNIPGAAIGFISGGIGGYSAGGGWGAVAGSVAGALVGAITPTASGAVGAAAGGFVSNILGQILGNGVAGNSLGSIDVGQAIASGFSGGTGALATSALKVGSVAGQAAVCSGVDAATSSATAPFHTGPIDFCVVATGKPCGL